SRGRDGMGTMSITDDQRAVTDLEKTLDALTAAREEAAGALPRSEALRESFWQHLNSGSAMLKPAYSTVIAVGVEDVVQLMRGEGDDVVLGLSDGTTMTGAEYLRMALRSEERRVGKECRWRGWTGRDRERGRGGRR